VTNAIIKQSIKKFFRSSTLKTAGIYTLANFANAAIPFFLMPVMTYYLSPADYGIIAVFGVLLGICSPFIGLNTSFAISVKYFKIKKREFPKYVANSLIIATVSCIFVIILFNIFDNQIARLSNFPQKWLWAVIIVCFSNNIIAVLLSILRSSVNPHLYISIQFLQIVMNMGMSLWFIVWLHMNWQGRISAQVITALFFSLISVYLLYKNNWLVFQYDIEHIKNALRFGVPLLSLNICDFIISLVDRFIIVKIIGLTDAGIYSVGMQLSLIVGFIVTASYQAYMPWIFNKLNDDTKQVKSKIVFLSYIYMIILLIVGIISIYTIPIIIEMLIDKKFHDAASIITWAVFAQVISGMLHITSLYINYVEQTHLSIRGNLFAAIIHLIFCYILVKENGIIGAAQACALTQFFRFIFFWRLSNKIYAMPWFNFYKDIELFKFK
jgi:O-antigen/teichoic acid export membrane protein